MKESYYENIPFGVYMCLKHMVARSRMVRDQSCIIKEVKDNE